MPVPHTSGSASPSPAVSGDGVLRIGTLLPVSGNASFIAAAQAAGVETAVREINSAGGVLGKPVQVLPGDSGDATTTKAEQSFADLVAKGAGAVIGPSSSVLAVRVAPLAAAAGVPLISPAATSSRLSTLGNSGYFFRTIASAATEGGALATILAGKKVALIYLTDDGGAAVRASLIAKLATSKTTLVADQGFTTGTADFAPIVAAVTAAAPDATVLVSPFSSVEQNKAIITQLTAAGLGGAKLWLTGGSMADYSQALPAGLVNNANGLLEGIAPDAAFQARVKAVDPTVSDMLYAAEAYDATILAALAATVSHSTSGAAVARNLRSVSAGGIKCTDFAQCISALKTHDNIDYDGLTGAIALDSHGDPNPAHFGVYRYDAGNRFARVGDALG